MLVKEIVLLSNWHLHVQNCFYLTQIAAAFVKGIVSCEMALTLECIYLSVMLTVDETLLKANKRMLLQALLFTMTEFSHS